MTDFPGLEGVVAVETEIAEPDREGGSLRYRGVDIEELVGHYPYESVWGLLVDDDLARRCPSPSRTSRPPHRECAGGSPGGDGALSADWKLGKLHEISDEQARDDLGRLSSQMMAIVARSARLADGHTIPSPTTSSRRGRRLPRSSCSAGEARPTRAT